VPASWEWHLLGQGEICVADDGRGNARRDPSLRSATVLKVKLVVRVPGCAVAQDGIKYEQQFAHAGDQREFGRFAASEQALVAGAQRRVEADAAERGHVQGGADGGASAPTSAPAIELSALMRMWRDANQRRDFAPPQAS
jgi:hypothetical protein